MTTKLMTTLIQIWFYILPTNFVVSLYTVVIYFVYHYQDDKETDSRGHP